MVVKQTGRMCERSPLWFATLPEMESHKGPICHLIPICHSVNLTKKKQRKLLAKIIEIKQHLSNFELNNKNTLFRWFQNV